MLHSDLILHLCRLLEHSEVAVVILPLWIQIPYWVYCASVATEKLRSSWFLLLVATACWWIPLILASLPQYLQFLVIKKKTKNIYSCVADIWTNVGLFSTSLVTCFFFFYLWLCWYRFSLCRLHFSSQGFQARKNRKHMVFIEWSPMR